MSWQEPGTKTAPVRLFGLSKIISEASALAMIITLPDDPVLVEMGEAEIRLDLACGAYAAGHFSRGVAARMAGLDRLTFDQILTARRIPSYDEEGE